MLISVYLCFLAYLNTVAKIVLKSLNAFSVGVNDDIVLYIKSSKSSSVIFENGIERMKTTLLAFMELSGQDKVKTALFSVSTATTQAVQITDESKIPCTYLVEQPPKIDKIGIKQALKDGEVVAGAELVENKGVRIR